MPPMIAQSVPVESVLAAPATAVLKRQRGRMPTCTRRGTVRINYSKVRAALRGAELGGPGCWLWVAGRNKDGYGVTTYQNKSHGAHRLAYEVLVGPVPAGMHLDHLCRNRACIRPSHMEPVLPKVNYLRGESPMAQFARQPNCNYGHPLIEGNLTNWSVSKGYRTCLTCARRRCREYAAKKRARLRMEAQG